MNELELIQPKDKYNSLIEYDYYKEEYQDNEDIEKQLVVKDEISFITIENIIKEDSRNIHICKLRNKYKYQLNYSISYDNNYTAILINIKVEDKKGYENGTIIIECKHIYNFLRTLKAILYNLKDTDIHYKTIKEIAEMYITDLNYDNFLKYYYIVNQIALATGIFIYPKLTIIIPKRTISKGNTNLCPDITKAEAEEIYRRASIIQVFTKNTSFEDFFRLFTNEDIEEYKSPIEIQNLKRFEQLLKYLIANKHINTNYYPKVLSENKVFSYKGRILNAKEISVYATRNRTEKRPFRNIFLD